MASKCRNLAKAFVSRHLVQQLQLRLCIAPYKLQTAGSLLIQDTIFIAFNQEGSHGAKGNRINAICITVEIHFQDYLRIGYTAVRTNTGCCLILRTIHTYFMSLIRTCL